MAEQKEEVSIREFGRRMGVSDTAIRNEVYDKKTCPNGCLRAGVGKNTKNGRPVIKFDIAYAEWIKAGRTIKNEAYYPPGDATIKEKFNEMGEQVKEVISTVVPLEQPNTKQNKGFGGSKGGLGYESLVYPGMNPFQAEAVKATYDAGIKELQYLKNLGVLAPVERVKTVLFEYGQTIKASLLQIPARIASRVRAAGSDREAQDIMYGEFEALLLTLSTGPSQSMSADAKDDFDKDAETYPDGEA